MVALLLSADALSLFIWSLIAVILLALLSERLWKSWGRERWLLWRIRHYRWLRYKRLMQLGFSQKVAWNLSEDPIRYHRIIDQLRTEDAA